MRDRLAKEWPPIPPRRGIQSIDARRTSSQQHQFQELSQPQNSRTNELNCPLRHLHPRSNNNDDDSPTMMMRGGWRRNPFTKIVWKSSTQLNRYKKYCDGKIPRPQRPLLPLFSRLARVLAKFADLLLS